MTDDTTPDEEPTSIRLLTAALEQAEREIEETARLLTHCETRAAEFADAAKDHQAELDGQKAELVKLMRDRDRLVDAHTSVVDDLWPSAPDETVTLEVTDAVRPSWVRTEVWAKATDSTITRETLTYDVTDDRDVQLAAGTIRLLPEAGYVRLWPVASEDGA